MDLATNRPAAAQGRRPGAALLGGACVVAGALGLGASALIAGADPSADRLVVRRVVVPAAPIVVPPPTAAAAAGRPGSARRTPRPVGLVVPAIGLRARVVSVGLAPDRTLHVPGDITRAGWWKGGARPGDPGPAVIVGHVDATSGPAVFYRVPQLRRGDAVRVVRADGRVVAFRVRRVAHYAKRRFPTRSVYAPTPDPTLRLITCSGRFDASTGHYLDNTIVFATERRR